MEAINCDGKNYYNNGHRGPYEQFFQHISNIATEIFSIYGFISRFKKIFQPIRAQGRVALINKIICPVTELIDKINKEIDQTVAAEEMNKRGFEVNGHPQSG